jgi:hypothetical protein
MRAVSGALVACLFFVLRSPADAQQAMGARVDVVIQSGHEGRPASCAPNHVRACNIGASSASGADREIAWTPIVADAAAAALRRAGYRVERRPADYPAHDVAKIYIAVHFDGAEPACSSGTSVGFPATTPHAVVARWERLYRARFPFRFVGENISAGEAHYYGYRKVDAPEKLLIEYGEITCPAQAAWLRPRLRELGALTARFAIGELR